MSEEWEDWGDEGGNAKDDEEEVNPEQEEKIVVAMQRLRNFQFDLADDMVLARINKELRSIAFDKLMQYYRKKSNETDLASLTIKNELSRMDYEVIYNKEKTTDKERIVEIFGVTKTKEIWCLANQSIYGDILTTLQMYFLSSELCITINNSDSKFVVDVDSDTLHSESAFAIGCNKMVELATIKSSITVSIRDKAIKQVLYSPELKVVFDNDLREAAAAVVEIEDVYQRDGGGFQQGSRDRGSNGGIKEKLENIDIEAVRERLLETSQVVIGHVGGFLTQLPVVSKLVDHLQAEGERETWKERGKEDDMEGIIDFTDTTGLGHEGDEGEDEMYYSNSDEDEPGPVAAIAGTLFQWGGVIGSNIVSGVERAIEKVKEDQAAPQLYRRESSSKGNRAKAGDNKGDERGQRGYSDLPGALPAAGDAGLTFSRQSEIHSQGLKQEEDLLGLSTPSPSAQPNPGGVTNAMINFIDTSAPAPATTSADLLDLGSPSAEQEGQQQAGGVADLLGDMDLRPPPPVHASGPPQPGPPPPGPGPDSVELRKKTSRRHR